LFIKDLLQQTALKVTRTSEEHERMSVPRLFLWCRLNCRIYLLVGLLSHYEQHISPISRHTIDSKLKVMVKLSLCLINHHTITKYGEGW